MPLPRWLGIAPSWGAAGLTASAGIAGWVEMLLLRSTLNGRIGRTGLSAAYLARLWTAALTGAAVAWAVKLTVSPVRPVLGAVVILGPYGVVFLVMTAAFRLPEATSGLSRVLRARGIARKP